MTKVHHVAKTVLFIAGITLIIIYSISLAGGILGISSIMGKTTDEIVQELRIKPIFPMLIFFGAVLGLIASIIYIVAAIYLLRQRTWARKFLLWYIPLILILDIGYLFGVGLLNKNTVPALITDFVIWIILLNKNIKDLFKEDI